MRTGGDPLPCSGVTARNRGRHNVAMPTSRRDFLKHTIAASSLIGAVDVRALAASATRMRPATGQAGTPEAAPWYRRTLRWGQTNIRETDPPEYDIAWWRQQWKRTQTQAVIINAGGIVAYYPSKFPLHHRASGLGDRDLYGELTAAAREDGLVVVARMDSNRAHDDFHRAHPDWFAVNADGRPYLDTGLYVACVNSPYYDDYIPSVLREIIERSHPEGFADNNWNGLGRDSICYCDNCARSFRDTTGQPIPRVKNWDDPTYRRWIQWNYARRLEIWELFNRTTRDAGGADCLWIGMNSGSITGQARAFRDFKGICERSELVLLDHQARSDASGFQSNAEAGKRVHGLLGWDKLVPESMSMYQNARNQFRLSSKPVHEAQLWMLDGFAGGIQPWWHHIGAYQEDRRMLRTAEPVMRWHAANERYLVNRRPVANVGLVWSQQNADFYGRDAMDELVDLPSRGWVNALVRARIQYVPVHIDHIARDAGQLSVLILPDIGAMSAAQVAAVKQFVARGGHLVATGESSRFDEWGDPRADYGLADLFGAHVIGTDLARRRATAQTQHSYLRLTPELRARVDGPTSHAEPPVAGERHAALAGLDDTDILAYGGDLAPLRVDRGAAVLATYIPPFPIFPPEDSWMRQPHTDIPGLIVSESRAGGSGRVAFLPADLDRRYGRENLPDHGDVLANLVRWAAGDTMPLRVEGAGFVDCHLYRQDKRFVLHLVNLTSAGTWRAPVDELIPVGPLHVSVRMPAVSSVQMLVSMRPTRAVVRNGWASFDVEKVADHEVAVINY